MMFLEILACAVVAFVLVVVVSAAGGMAIQWADHRRLDWELRKEVWLMVGNAAAVAVVVLVPLVPVVWAFSKVFGG